MKTDKYVEFIEHFNNFLPVHSIYSSFFSVFSVYSIIFVHSLFFIQRKLNYIFKNEISFERKSLSFFEINPKILKLKHFSIQFFHFFFFFIFQLKQKTHIPSTKRRLTTYIHPNETHTFWLFDALISCSSLWPTGKLISFCIGEHLNGNLPTLGLGEKLEEVVKKQVLMLLLFNHSKNIVHFA